MSVNNDKFLEIHDRIEELIEKLIDRCYEVYGADQHQEIAKQILNSPETISITDKEITDIMREITELERKENSGNELCILLSVPIMPAGL